MHYLISNAKICKLFCNILFMMQKIRDALILQKREIETRLYAARLSDFYLDTK